MRLPENATLMAVTCLIVAATPQDAYSQTANVDPTTVELTNGFDHIGAEVHSIDVDGRAVFFIDDGSAEGRPVVFIGGQGTSLAAFQLTEFNRATRLALGLRMISVERNGFGESPLDPERGYADYASEILAVLNHLGVDKFAIVAISGGGAYAAHLAAREPDRVLSLHATAASPRTLPTRSEPDCSVSMDDMKEKLTSYTHTPKNWWGVPGSPVLVIPGWQAEAYGDATRSFYVNGQLGDPTALATEYLLPCSEGAVADTARISAPAYLYWGSADKVVPVAAMEQWQAALPNVVRATVYEGQGHTVQYRHWDQVLADIAGVGDHTVLCRDGQTQLVANADVGSDAFLGNCAWQPAE
ncbi:alpha/beta hydrolase [Sedimentitalea sp.]|uniref:alpha/beta fold hydrolase n=1 Tax=Sedimentitalea sp. TaxID=2048915 RepID=UPI0032968ADC